MSNCVRMKLVEMVLGKFQEHDKIETIEIISIKYVCV